MLNMAPEEPGLYFRATDNSLFKVGPTYIGTVPPNDGPTGFAGNTIGEMWLDVTVTNLPVLKIWDGSVWQEVSGTGGGGGDAVVSQPLPPDEKEVMWYDTLNNTLKFYDGYNWVEVAPQADWDQSDASKLDYIKNKPTKVSEFDNDAGYLDQSTANTLYLAIDGTAVDSGKLGGQPPSYYAPKSDIPTNNNELTNGAGYITADDVLQSDWSEVDSTAKDFIKSKPDLSIYQEKNDVLQSNWTEVNTSSDAFIKNKPTNLSQFNSDISVNAMTDVNAGGATDGQILIWNGTEWGNGNQILLPPTAVIIGTADVADPAPADPEIGYIYIQTGAQPSIADASWKGLEGQAVNDGAYLIFCDNQSDPQWFIGSNISAQVQSDWSSNDVNNPEFIRSKPDLSIYALKTDIVQSDWDETTGTDPAYILNKPTSLTDFTNDLVNDSTVTLKDSGDNTLGSFSTNQAAGSELVIPEVHDVTITINDSNNDEVGSFTSNEDTATVITLPAPPEVGNGLITINQGGSEVGKFTLNQSGPETINLSEGRIYTAATGKGIDITGTEISIGDDWSNIPVLGA